MENMVEFKYFTGSIKMELDTVLSLSAARVKALVKAATENMAEVIERISARVLLLVDALGDTKADKVIAAKLMDILTAINPGAKRSAEEKAALRIIKSAQKLSRLEYAGAFEDAGYQCITDGYRLVRFSTRYNLPFASRKLDTAGIIGDASRYSMALELPEAKALKKAITSAKKGLETGNLHIVSKTVKPKRGREKTVYTYCYDFGYGLPAVNAAYLLDMLEAFPGAQAFYCGKSSPIYFSAENGDGILLPIRKTEEWEPEPVAVPAAESAESTDAATAATATEREQAQEQEQADTAQKPEVDTTSAAKQEQEQGPDTTGQKLGSTPATLPEVLPVPPEPPQANATSAISAPFCGFLPTMVSQHTRTRQKARNARQKAFCAVSVMPVLSFCVLANRPPGKYL